MSFTPLGTHRDNAKFLLKIMAPALLILATIVSYANVTQNDFVWDDRPLILENHHLRSIGYLDDLFLQDFFSHSSDELKYGYYRPLITLSYMVDLSVGGDRPAWFHVANVLWHLGCVLLVWRLALRLLADSPVAAWAAALVFAVHPIHTESVTWIAGRTDVICAFFYLSAMLLQISSGRRPLIFTAFALSAYGAALLSKEMAVSLPVVLLFYYLLVERRPLIRAYRPIIPFIVLTLLYMVWRWALAGVAWNPAGWHLPGIIPLTLVRTFWAYILKLVWPADLSAYIQNPPVQYFFEWPALVGLALSAGLLVLLAYLGRLRSPAFYPLVAFLISLLPLANIIKISAPIDMGFPMSERFLYLPSAFFLIGAAWGWTRLRRRRLAYGLLGALVILGAVRTLARNTDWHDEETFFRQCLEKAPDAPLLHAALGIRLARDDRFEDAVVEMQTALALNRKQTGMDSVAILNNLAVVYRLAGRCDRALPILLQMQGQGQPGRAAREYNLGKCYFEMGRLPDAAEAFRRSLQTDPEYGDALVGLAETCEALGEYAQAIRFFREAVRIHPASTGLYLALGVVLKKKGDLPQAADALRQAIALDSRSPEAYGTLGIVLAMQGQSAEARASLERAVALKTDYREAWNALGMLDALEGRMEEARRVFATVLAADPTNTEAMLNEGILAYQEGRLTLAAERFARVLELDPNHRRASNYLDQINRPPF